MPCACKKSSTPQTIAGRQVTGYTATYNDGTSETFLTQIEASRAVRKRGGGTIKYSTT